MDRPTGESRSERAVTLSQEDGYNQKRHQNDAGKRRRHVSAIREGEDRQVS